MRYWRPCVLCGVVRVSATAGRRGTRVPAMVRGPIPRRPRSWLRLSGHVQALALTSESRNQISPRLPRSPLVARMESNVTV